MAEFKSKEAKLVRKMYDHLIKSIEKEDYSTRMMVELSLVNLPDMCKVIDIDPEARKMFMGMFKTMYADMKAYFKDENKK